MFENAIQSDEPQARLSHLAFKPEVLACAGKQRHPYLGATELKVRNLLSRIFQSQNFAGNPHFQGLICFLSS